MIREGLAKDNIFFASFIYLFSFLLSFFIFILFTCVRACRRAGDGYYPIGGPLDKLSVRRTR